MPLRGVTASGHKFAMGSEWMENGNVMDFTNVNPDANTIELVRLWLGFTVPYTNSVS